MIIKPGTILYNRFSNKYYEVYSVEPYAKYPDSQHTNRMYYYRIQPLDKKWLWDRLPFAAGTFYHFMVDLEGNSAHAPNLPQPQEYKGTSKFKTGIELHQAVTGSFKAAGFEVANKAAQVLYGRPKF